jgi:predicted nuclease of predicted toxin-antitoxin system
LKLRFLADADFNLKIVYGTFRREPGVDFLTGHQVNLVGMPDSQVLALALAENRVVLTHDVHTMPAAFAKFLTTGSAPGILMVHQKMPIGDAVNAILRIWEESVAEEWRNRIVWL